MLKFSPFPTWMAASLLTFTGCGADEIVQSTVELDGAIADAQSQMDNVQSETASSDLIGGQSDGVGVSGTETLDSTQDTPATGDTAGDAAPALEVTAPKDGETVQLGKIVSVKGIAKDDVDPSPILKITVTSDKMAGTLATAIAADDGAFAADVAGLPAGPQTLTVEVRDPAGNKTQKLIKILVNSPPGAPSIQITPAAPIAGAQLNAEIVMPANDVDRKPSEIKYAYLWSNNGVATQFGGNSVPGNVPKKGQIWQVQVIAQDPFVSGAPALAAVKIGNTAPLVAGVKITATQPINGTLTCALDATATDADGDALTTTYSWTINGLSADVTAAAFDFSTGKTPGGLLLKAGDKVQCGVSVGDGSATATVSSNQSVLTGFDVCASPLNPCDLSADCSNTDTMVPTCACKPGFVGDGKTCGDIDECAANTAGCAADAVCANTIGGATCTCKIGFGGDGKICEDIDECLVNKGGCDSNANCFNTKGGSTCTCHPGFSGDGKTCEDINECLVLNGGCDLSATCSNLPGSYACVCNFGFSGDGKTCSDINECVVNNGGCSADGLCNNSPGSFSCACKPGFSGDGKICSDIDECIGNAAGCSDNAVCSNSPGSFTCTCTVGFAGDGKTCADINECAVNNGGCSGNAGCTNVQGSFTCACKGGFTGDGKTCSDINECLTNNGGCSADATCGNTQGSFFCTCNAGFIGDGKACGDVNECLVNNGGCSPNALCTNSPGSFSCTCKAGFSGDGKTCSDVNECLVDNGGCNINATCANTQGSFTCACKNGFSGDGVKCTAVAGCADLLREGFTNATTFPNIAGCSGGWTVPGVDPVLAPSCNRGGGDDGANAVGTACNVTDLCQVGFHVCLTSAEVKAKSSSASCVGATDPGAGQLFFTSRQSGPGNLSCVGGGTNDLFGCGNYGFAPAADCAPLNVFSGNLCGALAAPWACGLDGFTEAKNVTKPGATLGGVLCCRD